MEKSGSELDRNNKASGSKFNTGVISADADSTSHDSLPSVSDLMESLNELSDEAIAKIGFPEALWDDVMGSETVESVLNAGIENSMTLNTDFNMPLVSQSSFTSYIDASPTCNVTTTSKEHSLASNTAQPLKIVVLEAEPAKERYVSKFFHPDITQLQVDEVRLISNRYAKYFKHHGYVSSYIWEKINAKVLSDNKHIEFVLSPLEIFAKKKEWAVQEACKEREKDQIALTFLKEAMEILTVFDYIPPTNIVKCIFVDPSLEPLYIVMALAEMNGVGPNYIIPKIA